MNPIVCVLLIIAAVIVGYGAWLLLHRAKYPNHDWEPAKQGNPKFSHPLDAGKLKFLDISPYCDPETILFHDGWLYCCVAGGKLIRLRENGTELTEIISTGGSILGFDFDPEGRIWFVDSSYHGGGALCLADPKADYKVQVLTTGTPACPLTFPDALCLTKDGSVVYFTDASVVSPANFGHIPTRASNVDLAGHTCTGKIWHYDITNGELSLVASGFSFANGIQLTQDEKSLLVNETSGLRLWKVDAAARNIQCGDPGTSVLIDAIPGFPDNLTPAGDGTYWVGLSSPSTESYAALAHKTVFRRLLMNLPAGWRDKMMAAPGYLDVFRTNEQGDILQWIDGKSTGYALTTGVCQKGSRLYISHINGMRAIAWVELPATQTSAHKESFS